MSKWNEKSADHWDSAWLGALALAVSALMVGAIGSLAWNPMPASAQSAPNIAKSEEAKASSDSEKIGLVASGDAGSLAR